MSVAALLQTDVLGHIEKMSDSSDHSCSSRPQSLIPTGCRSVGRAVVAPIGIAGVTRFASSASPKLVPRIGLLRPRHEPTSSKRIRSS